MVETEEDAVETSTRAMNICCPNCKSRNVIIKESSEGYYWIYLCNNCGYQGKEGDKIGCLDKNNEPKDVKESS